jgi:protein-tyrosine phosphatase
MGIREVPDPYYGGPRGFEQVFDLVEAAAQGLLEDIRQRWR